MTLRRGSSFSAGHFADIELVATAGTDARVAATVVERGAPRRRLFRLRGHRLRRLSAAADAALESPSGATAGKAVLVGDTLVVAEHDPSGATTLVALRDGRRQPIVAGGDPTPLGGTYAAIELLDATDAVTFVADMAGGSAPRAVLVVDGPY